MKIDNKSNPLTVNGNVIPKGISDVSDKDWAILKANRLVGNWISRGLIEVIDESRSPKSKETKKVDAPVIEPEEERVEAFRTTDYSAKDAKEWISEQFERDVLEAAIEGEQRSSVLRVFEERLSEL